MYSFLPFRFCKINSKYFLSNDTGEYVFLEQNEFQSLINKKIKENSEIYNNLISQFFIVKPSNLESTIEILATKFRTKKNFILNFTILHMIVPTLKCNSKCLYCQVSSKDSSTKNCTMNFQTAKKIIHLIFQSRSDNIKIEFQGGEPLLQFDLIKKIIKYSEKLSKFYHKNLEFVICTNLTLIDEEQLKFISKHPIWISTSLDGPKEIHDRNRPLRNSISSFDLFDDKLKLTRSILGIDRISALLTVTKIGLSNYREIINEYINHQFHSIFLRALNPFGLAIKNRSELEYSTNEFIEYYKNSLLYIIQINIDGYFLVEEYSAIILKKILTPFSTAFVDLQSPAGLGLSCALYNYDGKIYASDEGRMLAETGDDTFYLGSINQDYEEIFSGEKIKNFIKNSIAETLPECSSCPFVPYCGADPVRNYVEQNDIIGNRMLSNFCHKNRQIIIFLLEIIEKNDSKIMNVFWSWITRRSLKQVEL
ncbi:MAG: His-Xaa-Ser system radical SAM maturase HxsB [Candidatus Cloacimonadales bacterium]|nr:His-Xaa-Ser system radical SAM maturase HxsB [Candidatus Cloacimonadales bacterium]